MTEPHPLKVFYAHEDAKSMENENMSAINRLSESVARHYGQSSGDQQAMIDPAMIAAIAELIFDLISKLQECQKKPDDVPQMAKSPSVGERLFLRRYVMKNLGIVEFRKRGRHMIKAMLNAGSEADVNDIAEVFQEAV